MKAFFKTFVIVIFTLAVSSVLVKYWPYIFARTVNGVISDVQRVAMPVAVVSGGGNASARDLFSFAVGIRDESGEIVTASSEDRQWAVAKAGQCAEAKFYPYPPWEFDKAGTYFGARLMKLHVCDSGKLVQPTDQVVVPAPVPLPAPGPSGAYGGEPQAQQQSATSPADLEAAAAAAAMSSGQGSPAPAPQGQ